jgi:dynactin complex subunit
MPRGLTKSKLSYSERKELAFDMFAREWKNADIARKIDVTPETIASYRREWEERKEEAVYSDPNYLNNIVQHTLERVEQLEEVIRESWNAADKTLNENAKVAALRTIKDAIMDIAKLQRLTDTRIEVINKTEQAYQVQQVILEMLNIVVKDCPRCRQELAVRLEEARQLREGPKLKELNA